MDIKIDEYKQILWKNIEAEGDRLQQRVVLQKTADELSIQRHEKEKVQTLIVIWNDLFRNGLLAWGKDLDNLDPPFCHITQRGREVLKQFSKDPYNVEGYLSYMNSVVTLDPIAESYISEALSTFNTGCYKASGVLLGAATERLIIQIAETLIAKKESLSETVHRDLNDWRIKRVTDRIKIELDPKVNHFDQDLKDMYRSHWNAFTAQIRRTRNEIGHPISINPITYETVHGSLLYCDLAVLIYKLIHWIDNDYI